MRGRSLRGVQGGVQEGYGEVDSKGALRQEPSPNDIDLLCAGVEVCIVKVRCIHAPVCHSLDRENEA